MADQRKPSKDRGQVKQHNPPPDPKQIRRELGWELIEAERETVSPPHHQRDGVRPR